MNEVHLKRSIQRILIIGLWLTPIFSAYEVVALIRGTLESQSEALTPVWVKAIRDAVWIFVVVLSSARMLLTKKCSTYYFVFLGLFFFTTIVTLVSAITSPVLAALGLRWIAPIFVVFFLLDVVDEAFLQRVGQVLWRLLLLQLSLQIFQLFSGISWFGVNSFGLSARSPGYFLIPNTAAFFSVLCFFVGWFYSRDRKMKWGVVVVSTISVALTASGTGFVVLAFCVAMCLMGERRLKASLPIVGLVSILCFPVVASFTGRGDDYVDVSLGARVEIFFNALSRIEIVPMHFGIGTNAGVLLQDALPGQLEASILDSTYTSIVVNLGLVGGVFFVALLSVWIVSVILSGKLELYLFTVIFCAFAVTTIIPENFPANLLFAVLMGRYLKKNVVFRFKSFVIRKPLPVAVAKNESVLIGPM